MKTDTACRIPGQSFDVDLCRRGSHIQVTSIIIDEDKSNKPVSKAVIAFTHSDSAWGRWETVWQGSEFQWSQTKFIVANFRWYSRCRFLWGREDHLLPFSMFFYVQFCLGILRNGIPMVFPCSFEVSCALHFDPGQAEPCQFQPSQPQNK